MDVSDDWCVSPNVCCPTTCAGIDEMLVCTATFPQQVMAIETSTKQPPKMQPRKSGDLRALTEEASPGTTPKEPAAQ